MSKREFPLPERDKDGGFPAFTSVGCYTLIYYTEKGDILCANCASDTHLPSDEDNYDDDPATMCDVYWEGPTQHCENCHAPIESSYGDPDAEVQE